MTALTRREVIDAIVASAMASMLGAARGSWGQTPDAEALSDRHFLAGNFQKFGEFIELSAALTGITSTALAPESVDDGHGHSKGANTGDAVKQAYFRLATLDGDIYRALIEEFTAHKAADSQAAAEALLASQSPGVADLARSIIMAWYFGAWYEWHPDEASGPRFTIVNAEAYTQSWIWRIAQTHAPGYSNLRFGHWAFPPAASSQIEQFSPKPTSPPPVSST